MKKYCCVQICFIKFDATVLFRKEGGSSLSQQLVDFLQQEGFDVCLLNGVGQTNQPCAVLLGHRRFHHIPLLLLLKLSVPLLVKVGNVPVVLFSVDLHSQAEFPAIPYQLQFLHIVHICITYKKTDLQ